MAFSRGCVTTGDDEILALFSEKDLAAIYLNIVKIPCSISNPMRKDSSPSLGWYATDSGRLKFRDFATNERGTLLDFLCMMWNVDRHGLLCKLSDNMTDTCKINTVKVTSVYTELKGKRQSKVSDIKCKIRKWLKRDIDYWESYGVPLHWLKWAEVYPISHTIFTVGDDSYVFGTDPLAYAFVEHKDGNTTLKIYQPYNKTGRKWLNKNDRSVIGLWTKVPPTGDRICICSSLKDSLCLSANTGIPAIYVQGEGYGISKTAQRSLNERYRHVYIIFDNDKTGLVDGVKLANETGYTNLVLPHVDGAKDISDIYRKFNDRKKFKSYILSLFDNEQHEKQENCPPGVAEWLGGH